MASKISGYGRGNVDLGATPTGRMARTDAPATGAEAGRPGRGDSVRLTDTVTTLKQLEARLAAQPDVDQARVDQLRQRLAAGEYQVDAGRVADKLLRLEREL